MPITRTTMTDDDGSGTTGTILNNAWLQTIYGQVDAYGAGLGDAVPVAIANLLITTFEGAAVTASIALHRYSRLGANIVLWELISSMTTDTTTVGIKIAQLPFSFSPSALQYVATRFFQSSGIIEGQGSGTVLLYRADGAQLAPSSGPVYVSIPITVAFP